VSRPRIGDSGKRMLDHALRIRSSKVGPRAQNGSRGNCSNGAADQTLENVRLSPGGPAVAEQSF